MFNIGPGELIAISMVALLVLGPQRLPGAVRTVGRVVGELRRISSGFQDELRNAFDQSQLDDDGAARADRYRPPAAPDLSDDPDGADAPDVSRASAAGTASATDSGRADGPARALPAGESSAPGVGTEPTANEAAERAGPEPGEDHEGASTTDSAEKAESPDRPDRTGGADSEQDTETPRASGTSPAES